jgi:hypothetical protein
MEYNSPDAKSYLKSVEAVQFARLGVRQPLGEMSWKNEDARLR